MTFTSKLRQAALVLTIATSFSVFASNQSYAFSAEARQMCQGDAFRLCSSDIPNIPAVTACMTRRKAELSSGCRAAVEKDFAAKSRKVAND
jgi:hypothetical protein